MYVNNCDYHKPLHHGRRWSSQQCDGSWYFQALLSKPLWCRSMCQDSAPGMFLQDEVHEAYMAMLGCWFVSGFLTDLPTVSIYPSLIKICRSKVLPRVSHRGLRYFDLRIHVWERTKALCLFVILRLLSVVIGIWDGKTLSQIEPSRKCVYIYIYIYYIYIYYIHSSLLVLAKVCRTSRYLHPKMPATTRMTGNPNLSKCPRWSSWGVLGG